MFKYFFSLFDKRRTRTGVRQFWIADLPLFHCGFVSPSEVEESLTHYKASMTKKIRARNSKIANWKKAQSTAGRRVKRMRGFLGGIDTDAHAIKIA